MKVPASLFIVLLAATLPYVGLYPAELPPRGIVDWGKCGMRVVSVHAIEKLKLKNDLELKTERRDRNLLLIQIQGTVPRDGFLTLYPNSFGLQFLYRGVNAMESSKAWGLKGKNVDTGEPLETWHSDLREKTNLGTTAGGQVNVWFVCDVPKEVNEFFVMIPSLIETPIKLAP